MERGSTIFLRATVIVIGLTVLGLCLFALPPAWLQNGAEAYRPIILGMYVAVVPFFVALYQTLKLLGYIDKNDAFSAASVTLLGRIKQCAAVIAALFAVGLPYIYIVAQRDDAPGTMALGLVITFASLVITVFAAVLQKLLKNAIDIKSENDLTV